ncbi:WhiB family transcriptional regulator [Nakamurella sp.]|uniref:WhiB family transcriptional regulator n=1 Tax=Nakamurella sp. TaxID=1869182 RepID=UPI0037840241
MADTQRLPLPIIANWDWQTAGACRGMDSDAFFHPPQERAKGRRKRIDAAKAVCKACPVVRQCLDHALETREPYGVWGGLSEDERAERLGVQSLRYPAVRSAPTARRPPTVRPVAVGGSLESIGPGVGPVG